MMWWMALAQAEQVLVQETTPSADIEWKRCYPNHVRQEAMCTKIEVPVDHKDPSEEKMSLHVVKLPAIRANAEDDPVFVLAGGPGQGASEVISTLYPALRKIHQRRTLIFLDQRGTGQSGPLDCELPEDNGVEVPVEALQACVRDLPRSASWYQTEYLAADTNWTRQVLGYQSINIYGVSYGTRLSLTIMQNYPTAVRSAVLDGVVPFQKSIGGDFGDGVRHALDQVFIDCESTEDCNAAFPDLRAEYETVVHSLQDSGPRNIGHHHSITGVKTYTEVSDQVFWGVLQQLLYQGVTTSLIPYAIHNIATYDDWSTVVGWLGNSPFDGIPIGLYLSIMCAEDVPKIDFSTPTEMDLGVLSTTQLKEMCSIWNVEPVSTDSTGWTSDIPTLLLSGVNDPVTPPEYGDLALSQLRNATHVVVSGTAHNTIYHPCIYEMATDFYQDLNPQSLDTKCATELKRPPFILSATGTAP